MIDRVVFRIQRSVIRRQSQCGPLLRETIGVDAETKCSEATSRNWSDGGGRVSMYGDQGGLMCVYVYVYVCACVCVCGDTTTTTESTPSNVYVQ